MAQTHYYLYFAGYDGTTEQIGVATSTDQRQWQVSPQPIIPVGEAGAWDSQQTSNPAVLYENGKFRMWYQGVDADFRYRIGYAESTDGITWQKQPQVILERPGLDQLKKLRRSQREGYHQPLVLRWGDHYRLYFLDHRQGLGYIRVAQSPDGITWEVLPQDCLAPARPWEKQGLHYPWVIHDGTQFVLWYTSEASSLHRYLNRAVSPDGLQWRRDPDQPIIDMGLPRRVSRWAWLLPRKVLRLYPHYASPRSFKRHLDKYKATSWLGHTSRTLHDNLIYPLRARRYISFNNSSVQQLADGSYLMYFQAVTENLDLAIGSATSSDGITWQPQQLDCLRDTILQNNIEWCSVFDGDPHLLLWHP